MSIYTYHAGQRSGPHSVEDIQARIESGALSRTALAWYEGAKDWMPLAQVPGLKFPEATAPPGLNVAPPLLASAPPPLPFAASAQPHSMAPPPRTGLMITCGIGAIILALALLVTAATLLGGESGSGLPVLGLLLIPVSIGV